MPTDINELDLTDYGLKQIFGSNFSDATEHAAAEEKNEEYTCTNYTEEAEQKPVQLPYKAKYATDAEWHPVKERNWMDDLKDCAKAAVIFGGLNMLVWYWMEAGLMAESIALPSMVVCALLCGLGIGKVLGGGRK